MALSSDLVSQFVKITKDDTTASKETTAYGTVKYDGRLYVKLEGSDLLTPVSTTTNVENGDKVIVTFKDHKAVITGNTSSPAARSDTVNKQVSEVNNSITEYGTVVANKVTAEDIEAVNLIVTQLNAIVGKYDSLEVVKAEIESLQAKFIEGETITANDIVAMRAQLDSIKATFGDFEEVTTEDLEAFNAEIVNLKGRTAEFTHLSANRAKIDELSAGKADIDFANINEAAIEKLGVSFANIDFANIGEAAIKKIFSDSGLIRDLVVGDQTITGELVGVTIIGDLIKGNTIMADKLVVLGEDGLYYKLNFDAGNFTDAEEVPTNSLHGSVITANSITAEKVSVHDLVAFGATIGGFHITDHSLYSGVKNSVQNTTRGVYLDNEGQISLGDDSQFIRYSMREEALTSVVDGVLVVSETVAGLFNTSISDGCFHVTGSETNPPSIKSTIVDGVCSLQNNAYKLDISVDSVMLSRRSKGIDDVLDDVDAEIADYQKFVSKFSKYIRFMEDENSNPSDTAMTIGSGDSVITLEIDNVKGLVFKKNGVEFGSWDGTNFHTGNIKIDVEQRAQFGNFAYVPRSDGSLSFLKVGG